MKACVYENLLIRLAGDELDAAQREAVMTHLSACRRCQGAWEEMRSTWDLLGQVTVTPPARDLTGTVLARAAALHARKQRWVSATRVAAVIALASGVGIAAGLLTPRKPQLTNAAPVPSEEQVVAVLGLDEIDDDTGVLAGLFDVDEMDETGEAPTQEQPS